MLILLSLTACSPDEVKLPSTDDPGVVAEDPAVACPAAAGLVEGRSWTFVGDAFADKVGTSFDATRTLVAIGDGVYEVHEALTETFSTGDFLTAETVYDWHCADGALFFDGFDSAVDQSYGSAFSYGWSYAPGLTFLPADAAVGSSWQDVSVASYWYNDPASVAPFGDYESTNAITATETVGESWESLVAESVATIDDGSDYPVETDYVRSWADGVGMTADGSSFLVLTAVVDP